jgi:tetratricopeptide (TPR) repeat protein
MADVASGSRLLAIPPEIREEIYRLVLSPDANRIHHAENYTSYQYRDALVLFKLNRQICLESRKIFRDLNVLVRIETPWPEARTHVALEGHVPIVASGLKASRFDGYRLGITIDSPEVGMEAGDEETFLILLDDLHKFTRMWYYATLTHPTLNPKLRLKLSLHDPFSPDDEERRMPKALQRRLLMPFGMVKGLCAVVVDGDVKPYECVVADMRAQQREPHRAPEHCLSEAARLKREGNAALAEGRYHDALELYRQAWLAIHIVIAGHKRHIFADAFFGRDLTEEPYHGKNGQSERLILRVQLVANTCQVYLKLEEYEECEFWGMRTINILRDAMGADEREDLAPEDEAVPGFPAATEMGKIYYRTALAKKAMDLTDEARKLLRVAAVYLPRDEHVRKELASCSLRLG